MSESDLTKKIVASKELSRSLKGANCLTLVVRGHHTIEKFLKLAIDHVAPTREFREFERLPFLTRVELAIVLHQLSKESYPILAAFNKVRNRFAHNPYAAFRARSARDMKSCFSKSQRELIRSVTKKQPNDLNPKETLKWCVISICAELRSAAVRKIRERISHEITMRDIKDVLDSIPKEFHDTAAKEHDEKVKEEMRKLLGD